MKSLQENIVQCVVIPSITKTGIRLFEYGIKMSKRDWRLQSLTYNSKWKTEKIWEQTTDYWLSAAVLEIKLPFSIQCCLILFWWITIMKWQLWTNCYQYGFLRNIYVIRIRVVCNFNQIMLLMIFFWHPKGRKIQPTYMVVRLSNIRSKTPKNCIFRPFLSLWWTASQPFRLSHINALCINQ